MGDGLESTGRGTTVLKGLHMALTLKSRILPLTGLGVAVVLVLGGCSADGSDATGPASGETRTVTDVAGEETEIPVDPGKVVALDEPAALNLLAMGITPDVAFQGWKTVVPAELLANLGIEVPTTADYYPKLEEVAALEPGLIVVSATPDAIGELPDYGSIAPTLRAAYTGSVAELAGTWGGYFDEPERAEAIEDALAELSAEIATGQPEPALSLSALSAYSGSGDVGLYYMDASNPLHSVIDDAGFDRPELQDVEGEKYGGSTPFSPERLAEQDADIITLKSSPQFSPEAVTGLPLFSSLSGRAVEVDGDFWSGASLFAAYWVLTDLREFIHDEYAAGGSDDATARWEAFVAALDEG